MRVGPGGSSRSPGWRHGAWHVAPGVRGMMGLRMWCGFRPGAGVFRKWGLPSCGRERVAGRAGGPWAGGWVRGRVVARAPALGLGARARGRSGAGGAGVTGLAGTRRRPALAGRPWQEGPGRRARGWRYGTWRVARGTRGQREEVSGSCRPGRVAGRGGTWLVVAGRWVGKIGEMSRVPALGVRGVGSGLVVWRPRPGFRSGWDAVRAGLGRGPGSAGCSGLGRGPGSAGCSGLGRGPGPAGCPGWDAVRARPGGGDRGEGPRARHEREMYVKWN